MEYGWLGFCRESIIHRANDEVQVKVCAVKVFLPDRFAIDRHDERTPVARDECHTIQILPEFVQKSGLGRYHLVEQPTRDTVFDFDCYHIYLLLGLVLP